MSISIKRFTNNPSGVWGHCEEFERLTLNHECPDKTRYRCDICKMFVCANHQRQHMKNEHPDA